MAATKQVIAALDRLNEDSQIHSERIFTTDATPIRASVALILRFKPGATPGEKASPSSVGDFLNQEWVQEGDAQILFIKRAVREGDRWSAHVALPGGKRDPEDLDDQSVAVRETFEEVGLVLDERNSFYLGPLDQRLIKSAWSSHPVLVLCPYVYLITSPEMPELTLQASEVDSAFWVSVSNLLDPKAREPEEVSLKKRATFKRFGWLGKLAQPFVGDMLFDSVRLVAEPADRHKRPLRLWGLTLGVITDFLDLLGPEKPGRHLYSFPTFWRWDSKLILLLMSYKYVRRQQLVTPYVDNTTVGEKQTIPLAGTMDWSGKSLDDYFDYVKRALVIAWLMRSSALTFLLVSLIRRARNGQVQTKIASKLEAYSQIASLAYLFSVFSKTK